VGTVNKIIVFVLAALSPFVGITFADASMPGRNAFSNNVPRPRLIEPVRDKIDLSGAEELVFKWSPHEGNISQRRHYDFRLYEGYQMVEGNIIFQDDVSANKHQIAVSADTFGIDQVYTWSLKQVYRSGKSLRSSSSFTITGK
jgi:hypothetical protein